MSELKKSLVIKTDSTADPSQIYQNGTLRITQLTSRLIRVESGKFTDLPSYAVWNRKFDVPKMTVTESGDTVTVETADVIFTIKILFPKAFILRTLKRQKNFLIKRTLKAPTGLLTQPLAKSPLMTDLLRKTAHIFTTTASRYLLTKTVLLKRETAVRITMPLLTVKITEIPLKRSTKSAPRCRLYRDLRWAFGGAGTTLTHSRNILT